VQSLGNGTAFSALAPSQRPGRRPSIQNIRERYSDYSPRPRIPGRLTSCRLVSSAPHSAFCQPDPHCLAVLPACHIPPGELPVCFDDA
jgi:hypothetical protein